MSVARQVTIPLEIRRKLNLKKGDLVTFVETEDGVLILPAELIARSRERRGELVEEEYNLPDSA